MPSASLKTGKGYPRRLAKHGHRFEGGQSQDVTFEIGRALRDDGRFDVTGLDDSAAEAAEAAETGGKPQRKQTLHKAIRAEADKLDMDVEENFEPNGQPSAAALSEILGYEVSADEVAAAMSGADPEETTEVEEVAETPAAVTPAAPAAKKEPRRAKVSTDADRKKTQEKKAALTAKLNTPHGEGAGEGEEAKPAKKGITITRKGKSGDGGANSETGDLSAKDVDTSGSVEV